MTFIMIAKYVHIGGNLDDITSMRADVLLKRLGQLVEKNWIPDKLRETIANGMQRLLD